MDDVKKQKLVRTAVLCTVIAIVTLALLLGTFAKYVTTSSYSDEARVAKWGLDITGTTESLFQQQYTSDVADPSVSVRADKEWGEHNVIAPGTMGEANLLLVSVDGLAPETMYDFDVDLEIKDTGDTRLFPVFSAVAELDQLPGWTWWYVADGKTHTFKTHAELETDLNKRLSQKHVAPNTLPDWLHSDEAQQPIRVGWSWKFESPNNGTDWDEADTRLGDLASGGLIDGLTVELRAKATQVLEGELGGHTVSFDTQGGSMNPPQQLIPDGGKVDKSIIENPGKLGSRFGGWFTDPTDPDTEYDFDEPVTSSFILYAHWNTAIPKPDWNPSKTITYDGNKHNVDDPQYWVNYDKSKIDMTDGTKEATDAGEYTVWFVPKPGYCWASDSSRTPINRSWVINQAEATIDQSVTWLDNKQTLDDASTVYTHENINFINDGAHVTGGVAEYTWVTQDGHDAQTTRDFTKVVKEAPGTYLVRYTVIPDKNHKWNGGVIGDKKITIWTRGQAAFTQVPEPADLTFAVDGDGSIELQELCDPFGESSQGTPMYAVTGINSLQPPLNKFTSDTSEIVGGKADSYRVWYYIQGKGGYEDSDVYSLITEINKASRNASLEINYTSQADEDHVMFANVDGKKIGATAHPTFDTYNDDHFEFQYLTSESGIADPSFTPGNTDADIIPYAGGDASIGVTIIDKSGNYEDETVEANSTVDDFAYTTNGTDAASIIGWIPFVDTGITEVQFRNRISFTASNKDYDVTHIGNGTDPVFTTKGKATVTAVDLSDYVEVISENAFKDVANLLTVAIKGGVESIPESSFENTAIANLATDNVDAITDTTGTYLIGGKNYTGETIEIDTKELAVIRDGAFKGNINLRKVSITCSNPIEVELYVGKNAFESCSAMENFVVAAEGDQDETQYGADAFKDAGSTDAKKAPLIFAGGDGVNNASQITGNKYKLKKLSGEQNEYNPADKEYTYLTGNLTFKAATDWWKSNIIHLKIPEGTHGTRDAVLDLNGKTIDRGLTGKAAERSASCIRIGDYNGGLAEDDKITYRIDDTTAIASETVTAGQITGGNCTNVNEGEEDENVPTSGGIWVDSRNTCNFVNGTITGNKGTQGGGFGLFGRTEDQQLDFATTFEMFGGVITGNTSTKDGEFTGGGAGYVKTRGVFKMHDGFIYGNDSEGRAGGIFIIANSPTIQSEFYMDGGIIKDNTCKTAYMNGRDLTTMAVQNQQKTESYPPKVTLSGNKELIDWIGWYNSWVGFKLDPGTYNHLNKLEN